MLMFHKEPALAEKSFPFGYVEVRYPEQLREEDFRCLVRQELAVLALQHTDYDRKAVFGEDPYFRYFRKFKKTYPVMMQFESLLFKGRPFPEFNPVAEVPFLMEVVTGVLSGTHDADRTDGPVKLYCADSREEFPGLRGEPFHTYPGDLCGRDAQGIVFSLIAGADERTCARRDSRHVYYPIFGVPGLPLSRMEAAMDTLTRYIRVLAPEAIITAQIL